MPPRARSEDPLPGPPHPWAPSERPELRDGPPYLMTEMIAAEPALAERIVRRLEAGDGARAVDEVAGMVHDAVRRARPVIVTGCGTSEHAAMAVAEMLGDALEADERWLVRSLPALEVLRHPPQDGTVIAVSHEGGTAATNQALAVGNRGHVARALVTVGDGSPGAQLADVTITTGELDQSWCHTVGYLSPLVAGAVVAGRLRGVPLDAIAVRALLEAASGQEAAAESTARTLARSARLVIAGTAVDWPAARELALKIEEGAGLPARALELETVRHGHLAACDAQTGLVLVLSDAEPEARLLRDRATAILRSAAALGMPAAAIAGARLGSTLPAALTPAGRLDAPEANRLPPSVESVLATAIPLQLLAERLARALGRNPDPIGRDDPRQLAAADA